MSARKEEWRDIPGYSGWYQISDWGRVRTWRSSAPGRKKLKTPKVIDTNITRRIATVCLKGRRPSSQRPPIAEYSNGFILLRFCHHRRAYKRIQKVRITFNFLDELDMPEIGEPVVTETTYGRRKTT